MSDTCKSCGAKIVWGTTIEGKKIPLNAVRVRAYTLTDLGPAFGHTDLATPVCDNEAKPRLLYVSHFTTCPNASKHSKRTAAGGQAE